MAWTNLETIGWGSNPTINCNFQYDRRRNGAAMEYNVWVGVNSSRSSVYFGYPIYCDIKVNGTTVKSVTLKNANPSTWSDRLEVYSGWVSVPNKTSGTTAVSIRLYSGSGSTRDNTYSYSMAVDPAGSTLTITGTRDLGVEQTLTVTRHNSAFTDSIRWVCVTPGGTIATKSSETTFTFTPPLSLAEKNTTGTSVTIEYIIDTYSGNTLVQSSSVNVVYTIPATVIPTAAVSISDPTGNYALYGAFVQGQSTLQIDITGTPIYSSPIASYSATADGTTYQTQQTITPPVQNTGAQTVSAKVKDARGRESAPATAAYNVLPYAAPKITAIAAERTDGYGVSDPTGHYVTVTFSTDVSELDNQNSVSYSLKYKRIDSGTWTTQALSTYTDVFDVSNGTVTFAADDDSPYDVQIVATDNFTSTTITTSAPMAFALINWNSDGDGIAFGGISTASGFQCYMDADFDGDILQNGTNIFPVSYANGGTGTVTQYNTHESGSLTSATTKTKTFTASGDGIVMLSVSMRSGTGTWGTTKVKIELNNSTVALATDIITSDYNGQETSANASAYLKVTNGDAIKVTSNSTRYMSGNTYDLWYNVLALGCTLAAS